MPKPGYLYAVWYRPDGEVRLFDDKALAMQRHAIQEPPVDDRTPWEPLGAKGAGKHLIVAFTKATPLGTDDAKMLTQSAWHAQTDWVRDRTMFPTGNPRTIAGLTRGAPQVHSPEIDADRYLGDLGTLLKYKWGCYYQAIVFRVN